MNNRKKQLKNKKNFQDFARALVISHSALKSFGIAAGRFSSAKPNHSSNPKIPKNKYLHFLEPQPEILPEWKWLWSILLQFKSKERKYIEKHRAEISEYLCKHVEEFQVDNYYLIHKDWWWTRASRRCFNDIIAVFRIPLRDVPLMVNTENPLHKAMVKYRLKNNV